MGNYSIIENGSDSNSESKEKNKSKKKEFHAYVPSWTMDEVVLSNQVRDSIEDAIAFCKNRKKIIEEWRTRQTLWRAVQMLTQKLCCQTIHDCPKVLPLNYDSEWQ